MITKMSEINLIKSDQEREANSKRLKELFTLENASKYYKKYSEDNSYTCTWVSGLEGELIQFAYNFGDEIVIERIHIDDLDDAGDWEHMGYQHGTEMIFSVKDLKDLIQFMEVF